MLRLANSPEQTHQRDQRQRCSPNNPGAASRAGGVSALSSSVAYTHQPDDSAQSTDAGRWRAPTWSSGGARRWGPRALRGRPSPQQSTEMCALPCSGLGSTNRRLPGVVLATCQMADGSCLGDCKWPAGGRTREATRAIYHQSALLHAQTDRGIVIYERNESRNKSEGVVEVCTAPKITFRMVSVY